MSDPESTWMVHAAGPARFDDTAAHISVLETRRRFARLPAPPPTSFVGRRAEIERALQLLREDSVRLLTLTGAGGIGKTRLALEIAHELEADFAGNVVWVSLAPVRDPALAVQAIAAAADIQDRDNAGLLDQVIGVLGRQRALLVLDNFEQIPDAASDLSTILRGCPRVSALVTSRAPLRISGEHVLVVPPLAVLGRSERISPQAHEENEGFRLFVDRARAVSPAFEVDAESAPLVMSICQRLDGLPLAIELAAARVYHLSVQAMSDRLSQRLPLLTGGAADLPDRQQTLRRSITWSYELLTLEEKRFFERLAVFSDGFSIEAAEAMGDDVNAALDHLTMLVDKSLVQFRSAGQAGPRYSMLETIHEYASERLTQSGDESAVKARHAAFFLSLARLAESEMARGALHQWVGRLEVEHSNFREALEWLAEKQQWSDYLQLVTALGDFWDTRGHLAEGRACLERALVETQDRDVPPSLRALAATWLALTLVRQGAFDEAEMHLTMAQAVWEEERNVGRLAFMFCVFGGFAEYRGDDEQAQRLFTRGLVLFREAGDPVGTATVLNNLADTAYRLGDLAQAAVLAEEAITIARDAGLEIIRATTRITIAEVSIARGEWRDTLIALSDGMHTSLVAGYQLGLADALSGFALVAAMTGDGQRAARLLGAVDCITGEIGVRRIPHQALRNQAVALTQGLLDEVSLSAASDVGQALSLTEVIVEAEAIQAEPSSPLRDTFTPRELDVLRLLASGETDRAIGAQLFISTRTVESHVANIYLKLGIHSRAEATAAARASGIAGPRLTPHHPESTTER